MFFLSCKSFSSDAWYDTHFCGIREGGGSPPPPPPIHHHHSFENRWLNIDILYIILKGILWRFRFNSNLWKIFWFRDFMSNFREMTPQKLQNGCLKNSYEYIIYSFEAHNLEISNCYYFRELFQFLDFMNTLKFSRNLFCSYFREILISREKIYINGIFRSHALKWCIICSHFKSLNFFGHPFRSYWGVISGRICS